MAQLKSLGVSSFARAQAQGEFADVPRILLAVDEFAVFSADTRDKQEKEVRAQAQSYIERLTLAARATGISVLLASQYPTADILGSQVRQQVFRICGRLDDEVASRTVLGVPGAEKIPAATPGRFLYVEGGELKEFQAYPS
ncbi:hypothetical protein GCM10010885_23850 [Alicyclobacillus cellulosilyticus]|uniref:FtsK/SpoIIIE family protein n=1 Tax=Alicyclobacillus cellulosilyticus TaxID=1003997 RepID=A0A917KJG4_9BACL|nr:hypothetical protein GCM10010885_23850 [Alicyclobacillus cellulosilyticus]